jgi:hypothetical protein
MLEPLRRQMLRAADLYARASQHRGQLLGQLLEPLRRQMLRASRVSRRQLLEERASAER